MAERFEELPPLKGRRDYLANLHLRLFGAIWQVEAEFAPDPIDPELVGEIDVSIRPGAETRGADGYYRVDFNELPEGAQARIEQACAAELAEHGLPDPDLGNEGEAYAP